MRGGSSSLALVRAFFFFFFFNNILIVASSIPQFTLVMYSWWRWQQSPSLINRECALKWLCGRCDRGWRARVAVGETAIWWRDFIRHHLAHGDGQKVIAKVKNADATSQLDKDCAAGVAPLFFSPSHPYCYGCSDAISMQNKIMQPINRCIHWLFIYLFFCFFFNFFLISS